MYAKTDWQKGTVYWITGLSGAGKTTLGSKLYEYMKLERKEVVFLDGDILREVFQSYDYSMEGRKSLAFQYARLCKMLYEQGIDVIICTISMFDEVRLWNRNHIANYVEIYLEVKLEELIKRDQKGLYSRAQKCLEKDVAGMNNAVELPKNPDLVIRNYGNISKEDAFECVIQYLKNNEGEKNGFR